MSSTPLIRARRRRTVSPRTGWLMAAEAATFLAASAVHFTTGFTGAAVPELIIACVLGVGSSRAIAGRARAWGSAVGTTLFATAGTMLGLTIIAAGRQDMPDLAYHASILTALLATLIILLRPARW